MAKNERSILEGLNFGAPVPTPAPVAEEKSAPAEGKRETTAKPAAETAKTAKKVEKPQKKAMEKPAQKVENPFAEGNIRSTYAATVKAKQRETRSVRTTISLTPRVYEHLTRATEAGDIKSANDLINYLLEQYFEG